MIGLLISKYRESSVLRFIRTSKLQVIKEAMTEHPLLQSKLMLMFSARPHKDTQLKL